jgi:hypothetical protein
MTDIELKTLETESKSQVFLLVLQFIDETIKFKKETVYQKVRDNDIGSPEPKLLSVEVKALEELKLKLENVATHKKPGSLVV